MILRQVRLVSGKRELTTWIPDDKRIKPGVVITLKGNARRWRLVQVYSMPIDFSPVKSWKVGGL